jgi:hypothetical protein
VGVLEVVQDSNIVELDVEVLVDALQGSTDRDVILELHCDLWYTCQNRASGVSPSPRSGLTSVDECLEETMRPCQSRVARWQSGWRNHAP